MAEPKKLGRYELRRVLGKGAMGVVYEAFDPALNRAVAVKTILKSIVADEETSAAYSARFAREAKAVARLSHPNIVQVYDFGEQGDVAFLVMEFLRGRELRAHFDERARFDTAEAVRIALELLDALEFAHESGVIHRDVKPANVMLDEQRRVKLADFGVARIQDGSERSKGGTMVGTPAFMSPEQVSGARVDRRTDLFSTGIVLYQLLTGEQPFKGDGAWTVAKAIMQDEPPRPSTVAGKVSPAFDAILSKALAKRPDQRFASAKDFAIALRAAQAGVAPVAGAQVADEAEVEFWRSIHASADPDEFRLYLKKFPQGVYAELAQLKLAKLSSGAPEAEPSGNAKENSALAQRAAQLEAQITRKEAEFREREAEAQAAREAEALKKAEADSRREAELKARAAAEAKAHFEALEKVQREARTALEKREAELRQREAEALAQANAEASARAAAEARARQEAEMLAAKARAAAEALARQKAEMLAAKARAEAEARALKETAALAKAKEEAEAAGREAAERLRLEADIAKREAEAAEREAAERQRSEADIAKREAEAAARETALRKKLAESHRAKLPLVPALIAIVAVAAVLAGAWYRHTSTEGTRIAQLTELLETSTRANQQLDDARRQREASLRELDLARAREEEARKSGDLAKLKEAQDAARRAETEAAKQADLVKQREAEAKKAEDTAKLAEPKKQTDVAKAAAEKIAMEKAAAEKASAEKAAAEKAGLERAAAEKAAAEKAALEKAAAEKLAVEKAATAKAAAAKAAAAVKAGWPSVGDRWVYEARDADWPEKKFQITVEVQSVTAAGIRDLTRTEGGQEFEWTHTATPQLVGGVAPGVGSFMPYLRAFQELRGAEQWSQVEAVQFHARCHVTCRLTGRVIGKERVTVRAGSYETWKIVVAFQIGGSVSGNFTFWYSEELKRTVKYQFRSTAIGSGASISYWSVPNIDMELVSYAPATRKQAATAEEQANVEKAGAENAAADKGTANSVEAQLERFIQRKGRDKVLMQEPPNIAFAVRHGEMFYVNDGSCPPGRIKEITGIPYSGLNPAVQPPRPSRCISLAD